MNLKEIQNALNDFGETVVKKSKDNLDVKGKGGGELDKSIKFKVVRIGDELVVRFYMVDYGTFQDKGVKGAGGEIKSGDHKGKWGGRRHYIDWQGKRQDSPYKFGSGKGKKKGIYKGIESFVRKKGLSSQGSSVKGITHAIVKVLWIKGFHGIGFFQSALRTGLKELPNELLAGIKKDIINSIKNK